MEKTITIGEREFKFKSSAATNILYKRAFKDDILVKLSEYAKSIKELNKLKASVDALKNAEGKTEEEILAELNALMNSDAYVKTQDFSSDTLPKLAYIMFLEANENIKTIFTKLNEDYYLEWLMTVDQDELLTVTGEVMDIWQAGTKTHSKPKN